MERVLVWLRRNRFLLLVGFTYAYFYQGGDPNQATRLALTRALVERHTVDITPDSPLTIDKSEYGGRYFSDKAPGVSLLAAAPFAALRGAERVAGLDSGARPVERARLHMLVFLISGLAGVLAAAMVRRSVELLGASRRDATLVAFAYALGTLAFPFSTVLFSHEIAAAFLVTSFAVCLGERLRPSAHARTVRMAIGALWALAVVTEYPSALTVGILGLYFLYGHRTLIDAARALGWVLLGAAPVLALHSTVLSLEFDSPFELAYAHVVDPLFRSHVTAGFLGVGRPRLAVLGQALLGPYRGLLFFCPVLVLVPAAFGAWARRRNRTAEAVVCAAVIATSLIVTSGYYAWDGDFSTGPRHLVAALPFFAIPMGQWVGQGRWAARVFVAAVVPSVAIMFVSTAVLVQTPKGEPSVAAPLYDIVLPALARHEVAINPLDAFSDTCQRDAAYNLGTLFGLGAWGSLLLLVGVWATAYTPDIFRSPTRG